MQKEKQMNELNGGETNYANEYEALDAARDEAIVNEASAALKHELDQIALIEAVIRCLERLDH
jgi:hypothetical protein